MSRFLDTFYGSPLSDGINWRHNMPWRYQSDVLRDAGIKDGIITSPPCRITDFTSSPKMIWNTIPPWGVYGPAALAHDEAYWSQVCDRDTADNMLREAMHALGVPEELVRIIYLGVRIGGADAWERNAALKKSGYTRMASQLDLPPFVRPYEDAP